MLDELSIDEEVPAYLRVADVLRAEIRKMRVPEGSPLPSLREVAVALGVGTDVVRRAYEHLEEERFVVTRPRRGYFIAPDQDRLARDRRFTIACAVDELYNKLMTKERIPIDEIDAALKERLGIDG